METKCYKCKHLNEKNAYQCGKCGEIFRQSKEKYDQYIKKEIEEKEELERQWLERTKNNPDSTEKDSAEYEEKEKKTKCGECLKQTKQDVGSKQNDDQMEISRDDLNENQKEIIRKATLTIRIIGIFLPGIYLLRARLYWTLVLLIFANSTLSEIGKTMGNGIGLILVILLRIGSSIRIYNDGSKWAFNTSKGYLKGLIHKR